MKVIHRKSEVDHYVHEAVVQLFGIQLRTGTSALALQKFAASCVDDASDDAKSETDKEGLDIHTLGSVLRSWHKETKYLSPQGTPRPLKVNGRTGLRELVCSFYPTSKFNAVFLTLRRNGLIRQERRGTWVPTAKHARISQLSLETLAHLSEGVSRFVETVTRNVTARSKDDLLFERSCKVRHLPISESPAFREFVRQQAFTFLIAVDDWLEARVVGPKVHKGDTCTAGVFTFAYLDTGSRKNKRAKQGRIRT